MCVWPRFPPLTKRILSYKIWKQKFNPKISQLILYFTIDAHQSNNFIHTESFSWAWVSNVIIHNTSFFNYYIMQHLGGQPYCKKALHLPSSCEARSRHLILSLTFTDLVDYPEYTLCEKVLTYSISTSNTHIFKDKDKSSSLRSILQGICKS